MCDWDGDVGGVGCLVVFEVMVVYRYMKMELVYITMQRGYVDQGHRNAAICNSEVSIISRSGRIGPPWATVAVLGQTQNQRHIDTNAYNTFGFIYHS